MNGRLLLDTNTVIALFAGERGVLRRLKPADADFLSVIVVGELMYGALNSSQVRVNLVRLQEFAAANEVLPCDLETARHYGRIKNQLRRKGRPLPENGLVDRRYRLAAWADAGVARPSFQGSGEAAHQEMVTCRL